jgi:hypothetical protein
MRTPQNDAGSYVFVGLDRIGALFGRTRWTIRRWIASEDFPACQLPDKSWAVSLSAVDDWLANRRHRQRGPAKARE